MRRNQKDRWESYVQVSDESVCSFLREHLGAKEKAGKSCLIVGKGFDPRMLEGLKVLRGALDPEQISIIMLVFNEGPTSPSRGYDELVRKNVDAMRQMVPGGEIQERNINMFSSEGRRITSRSAESAFRSVSELQRFRDIFVDVSSLPRSIYFPVLAKLLHLLDGVKEATPPNLFVLVSENAELDRRIMEEGIDERCGLHSPVSRSS